MPSKGAVACSSQGEDLNSGSEQTEKMSLETYRNDVNDWITKREDISNCNRVRALRVILTLAFVGQDMRLGDVWRFWSIGPPNTPSLHRNKTPQYEEDRLHRPASSRRPRSTST